MNIMYANLDIDPETPVSSALENRHLENSLSWHVTNRFQVEDEPTAGDWEDEEDEEELEAEEEVDASYEADEEVHEEL